MIPPADAPAGSNLTVWVMCFDAEKRYGAECWVTTVVNRAHGLEATVSPAEASLDPGGKAIFRVNVRNLGNAPDRCAPGTITLPSGWDLALFGPDGQMNGRDGFDVPYKGSGWFEVVVTAPSSALKGAYRIVGAATDGAGNRGGYAFTVDVNRVFGVGLEAPAPLRTGEPRSRVGFELNITNTGNGVDAFQLAATGLPEGWRKAEFRDMAGAIGNRPDIGPGRTGRMLAFVEVPASTPGNEVRFIVSASSEGGPISSVELALSIRKAELAITEVELLSGELEIGRPVMVRLTVRNGGEALAANVTVSYFRNREPRTTEELGNIPAGGEMQAACAWVPGEGKNELDFVVDPKNDICEYDETNNTAVLERTVFRKIGGTAEGAPWPVLVAAVPILFVGLYLVARAARKRKK